MKGALLINLGSPDSPDPKDVKRYLAEFLMDERVIDVSKTLRTFLVKGYYSLISLENLQRPTKKFGGRKDLL